MTSIELSPELPMATGQSWHSRRTDITDQNFALFTKTIVHSIGCIDLMVDANKKYVACATKAKCKNINNTLIERERMYDEIDQCRMKFIESYNQHSDCKNLMHNISAE